MPEEDIPTLLRQIRKAVDPYWEGEVLPAEARTGSGNSLELDQDFSSFSRLRLYGIVSAVTHWPDGSLWINVQDTVNGTIWDVAGGISWHFDAPTTFPSVRQIDLPLNGPSRILAKRLRLGWTQPVNNNVTFQVYFVAR